MYELSAGQQNVAVVKRCTLVEVRLYYLAIIASFDCIKHLATINTSFS